MSTITKFTPGPWVPVWFGGLQVAGHEGVAVCTMWGSTSTDPEDKADAEANAALIAAAPAMYDALESAIGAMEVLGHPKNYGALLKAQKVLAAARGEG